MLMFLYTYQSQHSEAEPGPSESSAPQEKPARNAHIATLAQRNLAAPGTSVPSERVFSTAGGALTHLTTENMDKLIFFPFQKNMKIK